MYQKKSRKVLGVDPGIASTGWCIVNRTAGGKLKVVDAGLIRSSKTEPEPKRIAKIYDKVYDLLADELPNLLAVEQVFYNRNVSSAMSTAGVVYVCLLAAEHTGIESEQITPQMAKASATGRSTASKADVAKFVYKLTGEHLENQHTADAAAVAIAGILKKGRR